MPSSDWSSDVCSSDLLLQTISPGLVWVAALLAVLLSLDGLFRSDFEDGSLEQWVVSPHPLALLVLAKVLAHWAFSGLALRSEEHTSELQSLMRISYAVFCLKKKK